MGAVDNTLVNHTTGHDSSKPVDGDETASSPAEDPLEIRCRLKMEDSTSNSKNQSLFRVCLLVLGFCIAYGAIMAVTSLVPMVWGTARSGGRLSDWNRADCSVTAEYSGEATSYEVTFVDANNVTINTKINDDMRPSLHVGNNFVCAYDPNDEDNVYPTSWLEYDYEQYRSAIFWLTAVSGALPVAVFFVFLIPVILCYKVLCLDKDRYLTPAEEAVHDFANEHDVLDGGVQIGPGSDDVEDRWLKLPEPVSTAVVNFISYLESKTSPAAPYASETTIVRGVHQDTSPYSIFILLSTANLRVLLTILLLPIMTIAITWPLVFFIPNQGFDFSLMMVGIMQLSLNSWGIFLLPLLVISKNVKRYVVVTNKWILVLSSNGVRYSPYPYIMIMASLDPSQHAIAAPQSSGAPASRWKVSYGERLHINMPTEDRARCLSDFINDNLPSV